MLDQALLGTAEVVLTSYSQLRIHQDELVAMRPHAVVFDEVNQRTGSTAFPSKCIFVLVHGSSAAAAA